MKWDDVLMLTGLTLTVSTTLFFLLVWWEGRR